MQPLDKPKACARRLPALARSIATLSLMVMRSSDAEGELWRRGGIPVCVFSRRAMRPLNTWPKSHTVSMSCNPVRRSLAAGIAC
jgi:hypothetical protein